MSHWGEGKHAAACLSQMCQVPSTRGLRAVLLQSKRQVLPLQCSPVCSKQKSSVMQV